MKPHFSLAALIAAFTLTVSAQETAKPNPKPAESKPGAPAQTLPEIVVTAEAPAYATPASAVSTRLNSAPAVLPVSVQSVPAAVMQDQQSSRVREALENVSGIHPNPSIGSGNGFILRGFADDRRLFRDGLAYNVGGFRAELDTATLERIEVLKGPSSVLFGRAEPGGLINLVSKRPLESAAYSLEQEIGSFDHYRTTLDAGGPLLGDDLLYRFVGAYQDSGSFRDFGQTERYVIAPSLTWVLSPETRWTLQFEHMHQDYIADFGIPVIGDRPADVPVERSFGDPNDTVDLMTRSQLFSEFTHEFTDNVKLTHRFLYTRAKNSDDFVNPVPAFDAGAAFQADGRTLNRNIFYQRSDAEEYATSLDLAVNLVHGSIKHEVVLGADYLNVPKSEYGAFGNYQTPNDSLAIDIFNPEPSYGIDQALFQRARVEALADDPFYSVREQEAFGVYLHDHVQVGERWHLLLGGRYDWAEVASGSSGTSFADADRGLAARRDEAFSPRAGVLWQALPELALYGSYTRSFGANNGLNADGDTLQPQEAEQFEVGLKAELFEKRLSATLAAFDLERQNLLTPDLATADPFDSIAVGSSRSRGVELDLLGRVDAHLSLIGSLAYTDTEVEKDNSGLQGNQLVNVPKWGGSLAVKYDFAGEQAEEGLSIGLGLYAQGDRQGDAANTFVLPAHTRFDAFAAYRWKLPQGRLTAQVNVRNLFDETYYESADPDSNVAPRLGVYPGAPQSFIFSLRYDF